jgi:hypothetical protein
VINVTAAELAVHHHLNAVSPLACNWTINSAQGLAWNDARLRGQCAMIRSRAGFFFLDSLAALDSTGKPDATGGDLTAPAGALLINRDSGAARSGNR